MAMSAVAQLGHARTRSSILGPCLAHETATDGLGFFNGDFSVFEDRAGSEQAEGESHRVWAHAREPADAQFQAEDAARLLGAIQFLFHLIDQGLDDGKFVHVASRHFSPTCATAWNKQCHFRGLAKHCLFQAVDTCGSFAPYGGNAN